MRSTCHNSPVKRYSNGSYYCTVCLKQHTPSRFSVMMVYSAVVIVLVVATTAVKAPSVDLTTMVLPEMSYLIASDIVPTDSTVMAELVKNNCVLTSVAVAQARLESGNYSSDIAVNNKNLFGIKVHKCQYVTGKRKGHATFATYKDNIACYCEIQHRYLKKIDRSYAEDPHYLTKVKAMK